MQSNRSDAVDWMEVAADTAALGLESSEVIGLRLARAATGSPKGAVEAWLMCSEKVVALAELQGLFLMGSLGRTPSQAAKGALKHYRKKVAANRRRLRKSV